MALEAEIMNPNIKFLISQDRKRPASYSPGKLERCLEAIESGEVSVRAAAQMYNIPRTTLSSKLSGHRPKMKCKPGPEPSLGRQNEELLSKWILHCCRRGFPIRVSDLRYSVESIIEGLPLADRELLGFKERYPARAWYYKFLDRHPDISLRKAEYLSSARAKVSEERIRGWFKNVEEILEEESALDILQDPRRVYNCDETAMYLNPQGGRVLCRKGSTPYSISSNDDKRNVTILFTAGADGSVAPPLYVHRGQRISGDLRNLLPVGWNVTCTLKGWMTCEAFLFYITEVFDKYLQENNIVKPVILFVDGHVSHLSTVVTDYCSENRIILICLLAFTTHLLQPLDLAVFRPLKEAWRDTVGKFRMMKKRDITKYEIPGLLKEILESYSADKWVVSGFRKSGLYPWNPDSVDYTKCIFSTELNPWLDDDNVDSKQDHAVPEVVEKTFMQIFEENISYEVLQEFQNTLRTPSRIWTGDPTCEKLYEMWLKLHSKNEAFATASTTASTAVSLTTGSNGMMSVPIAGELQNIGQQTSDMGTDASMNAWYEADEDANDLLCTFLQNEQENCENNLHTARTNSDSIMPTNDPMSANATNTISSFSILGQQGELHQHNSNASSLPSISNFENGNKSQYTCEGQSDNLKSNSSLHTSTSTPSAFHNDRIMKDSTNTPQRRPILSHSTAVMKNMEKHFAAHNPIVLSKVSTTVRRQPKKVTIPVLTSQQGLAMRERIEAEKKAEAAAVALEKKRKKEEALQRKLEAAEAKTIKLAKKEEEKQARQKKKEEKEAERAAKQTEAALRKAQRISKKKNEEDASLICDLDDLDQYILTEEVDENEEIL